MEKLPFPTLSAFNPTHTHTENPTNKGEIVMTYQHLAAAILSASILILTGCNPEPTAPAAAACTGSGSSAVQVSAGACPATCPTANAAANLEAANGAKADADAICLMQGSCNGTGTAGATTCETIETSGGVTECHTTANATYAGTCS